MYKLVTPLLVSIHGATVTNYPANTELIGEQALFENVNKI